MLKEDSDLPKFKVMPGITELIEEFEDEVKTAAAAFQTVGLEKQKELEHDQTQFEKAVRVICTNADKKAIALCTKYRKQAKRVRDRRPWWHCCRLPN